MDDAERTADPFLRHRAYASALRRCLQLDHGPGLHRQTMLGWIEELEKAAREMERVIQAAAKDRGAEVVVK